jgi:hypothetical protein
MAYNDPMNLAIASELVFYLLFLGWIASGALFLLLRSRLGPGEKKFLLILTALGAWFFVYELYMTFVWSKKVVAPIRIDLLLIVPFLCIIYAASGILTIRSVLRDRPSAGVRIPALVLSAFLLALPTWNVGRLGKIFHDGRERTQRFTSRERELFQARFRNPQTFERRFGKVTTEGPERELSGHWVAQRPVGGITRMVINDTGKIWTFRECGRSAENECLRGEGSVKIFDYGMNSQAKVEIKADVLLPQITLSRGEALGKIKLTVETANPNLPEISGIFERKAVPFQSETAAQNVTAHPPLWVLAPIADSTVREYMEIRRYSEGSQSLAVLFYRGGIPMRDTQADFLMPFVLKGANAPQTTLVQVAEGLTPDEALKLELTEQGAGARVKLSKLRSGEPLELKPGQAVNDEIFEIAPLGSLAETEQWFRTQSTGKQFSAQFPSN